MYPTDLGAWLQWQERRQSLARRLRKRFDRSTDPLLLARVGQRVQLLVPLSSTNQSTTAALIDPLAHLGAFGVGLLANRDLADLLGDGAHSVVVDNPRIKTIEADGPIVAMLATAYGQPDEHAMASAARSGGRTFVVQHGILTPFVPPLPKDCTLLAWSEADGEFWRSGRDDVAVEVVGSQLLWQAARQESAPVDPNAPATFLGQLHAAEIDRRDLARAAFGFCHDHGATYRPHPAEIDKLSRLQHAIWARRGVGFDRSGLALKDLATPVVAVFSTGVLEAAAAGRPAWVHHPDPPEWLVEFWDRYGLNQWGQEPTPAPNSPPIEPAKRIAEIVAEAIAAAS